MTLSCTLGEGSECILELKAQEFWWVGCGEMADIKEESKNDIRFLIWTTGWMMIILMDKRKTEGKQIHFASIESAVAFEGIQLQLSDT